MAANVDTGTIVFVQILVGLILYWAGRSDSEDETSPPKSRRS